MSRDNVELVKRQIGNVDLAQVFRDDDAWANRLAEIDQHFKEDFEFSAAVPGEPVTGRGFDDFRAQFVDWIEPWDTYEPNIEEIIDLGDRVVVLGRDRGTMRGTDREIEGPKGMVLYYFEDGKVARNEYYFDRDEGLRAAGLQR